MTFHIFLFLFFIFQRVFLLQLPKGKWIYMNRGQAKNDENFEAEYKDHSCALSFVYKDGIVYQYSYKNFVKLNDSESEGYLRFMAVQMGYAKIAFILMMNIFEKTSTLATQII